MEIVDRGAFVKFGQGNKAEKHGYQQFFVFLLLENIAAVDVGNNAFFKELNAVHVDVEAQVLSLQQFFVDALVEELATLFKQLHGNHIVAVSAGREAFEGMRTIGKNHHPVPNGERFLAFASVVDNLAFAKEEAFNKVVLVPKFVIAEVAFGSKG